jgi:hypothetical protein
MMELHGIDRSTWTAGELEAWLGDVRELIESVDTLEPVRQRSAG